jgi:hypothetical protein
LRKQDIKILFSSFIQTYASMSLSPQDLGARHCQTHEAQYFCPKGKRIPLGGVTLQPPSPSVLCSKYILVTTREGEEDEKGA